MPCHSGHISCGGPSDSLFRWPLDNGRQLAMARLHRLDERSRMLNLSKEERLVLFEFCHRICETSKIAISHHAEAVVIDRIASELERSLAEPFLDTYPKMISAAREQVLSDYRNRMGPHAWIEKLPLEQV